MKKKETVDKQQKQTDETPPVTEAGASGPFDSEDIRLKFEKSADERNSKERVKILWRLIIGIVITASVCFSMVLAAVNAGNAYKERQVSIIATNTAESLASKYQSADNLLLSGNPAEALLLYKEIKQVAPSYKDIDQKIALAEQHIAAMDLYQQGVQFMNNGDHKKALENLSMVEELYPDYRDTRERIRTLEQEQEIALLVIEIEKSYANEDWEGVIHNYEAIQVINPFIELPDLKDILFNSYSNLIIALSSRTDLTLEEIEIIDGYYRNAIALVPQDKDYAEERAELKEIVVQNLAYRYYLDAINLLESSNYSYNGLREAIRTLEEAGSVGSKSSSVMAEIDKARLFLNAYDDLLLNNWDGAITNLETLLRKDENYADGRAKYFLYEAYTARGDDLLTYADFNGALVYYQKAETMAWSNEENVLRLFQVQTRIAAALKVLDRTGEAAEYYNYAFELLDYETTLTDPDEEELLAILIEANNLYKQGKTLEVVRLYENAMEREEIIFDQTIILAKQNDTLANIAFEQGSTLERLRDANNISETMIINADREILVPVFQTTGP